MTSSQRWILIALLVTGGTTWWLLRPPTSTQPPRNREPSTIQSQKGMQTTPTPQRKAELLLRTQQRLVIIQPKSTRKPAPRKKREARRTSKFLRFLKEKGKHWGTLSNGSQLYTSSQKGHHHHHHSDGHEQASGGELWKVDKSGLATRMLPGETVTEVKVSKGSERISAVTTKRSLYVSGSKAGSPMIKVADKVNYFPAFGPKGDSIAYIQQKGMDDHQLFLQSLNKSGSTALVKHAGGLASPVFSPSGTEVIFVSSKTGVASLWKMSLPNGQPEQLTNKGMVGGGGLPPHFVPPPHQGRIKWVGKWLAFDAGDSFWVIREDGTLPKKLSNQSPEEFDWKQNGLQLVYRMKQGSDEVWYPPQ